MTAAAALLRELDGLQERHYSGLTHAEREYMGRLIPTVASLYGELAALVEAVENMGNPATLGIYGACVRINEALAALNAKAGEVGK